ncbi:CapA family protein [Desulforamulus aeronauticus]|uniref:Poly-gamma-glutamate synthesis protein (Capsule biosynthesis protein) n=1 Tax=Desulforamulus aeronauticus DSM 10349 TaxID=1121421 RepID=A0A1M6WWU3_9FIRM|nr:CapA family protein [Desulforamulus aeronauticus]SHK98029.1 poly-gamma-glutamate synthesis protein (capsule biosynthesis protein) [Desulforamulus aeronauticus DSM 10349]
MRRILMVLFFITLLTLPLGCGFSAGESASMEAPPAPPPPAPPETITITAVGDFLMHMPVIRSAQLADGSYDFKPIFSEVKGLLSSSDLTIANLETRLAGKQFGYSGYPVFNCPEDLAYDLKDLGVDVVTTANNHSLDRGWPGIVNTLTHLESAGLSHVGTSRSPEEANQVLITNVKNIKVGILNYTENTNGIPLPKGKEFAVNLMKAEKIYTDIDKLRSQGAEIIIAYLHFGTEYQRQPNEFQRKLVQELFTRGVDIVFGDHVHVIQPIDFQKVPAESNEKASFVVYSLGNFISNQTWRYSDCGLIVNIVLEKNAGGVSLKTADYIPVWVDTYSQQGQKKYRVLPVQKALEDYQAKTDPLLDRNDFIKLQEVWQDTTSLISEACPVIAPKQVPGGSKL